MVPGVLLNTIKCLKTKPRLFICFGQRPTIRPGLRVVPYRKSKPEYSPEGMGLYLNVEAVYGLVTPTV